MIRRTLLAAAVILVAFAPAGCVPPADTTTGDTGATPDPSKPRIRVVTTLGSFVLELRHDLAPVTVENFLTYMNEGFYNGTIIHRVVPGFLIQGGGYLPGLVEKAVHDPIVSESGNGLLNARGTIGAARSTDPNSATSQWYINLADNTAFDPSAGNAGFTVFGSVVEGLEVIDTIARVRTTTVDVFQSIPVVDVVVLSVATDTGTSNTQQDEFLRRWQENFSYGLLNLLRNLAVTTLQQLIPGR